MSYADALAQQTKAFRGDVALTKAWFPLRYHSVQDLYWNCNRRFVGASAGRGSGKTEIAKRKLAKSLPEQKPWMTPRYFYGAPTYEQAKRIAWNSLQRLIPKSWVRAKVGLKIETIFGSELYVVGLDHPERIEGDQWDGCVIDESCDIKPGTFDLSVLPALTHRNGWCWRIGVPKRQGPGHAEFREFCERAAAGEDPDAAAFTWPSSDILGEEQLRYARRNMDLLDFTEQFGGLWQNLGGGVFHAFHRTYNVRPVTYYRRKTLVVSSDFNVNPMCWVIGHRYANRLEFFDEIWMEQAFTQSALDALYVRYSNHEGGFEFYGDATARANKTAAAHSDYVQILNDARFRKLGRTIHYPEANPARLDRFAACNAMFKNADGEVRCFLDPRMTKTIRDLEVRSYKPGTRETADEGEIGHPSDALGYVINYLFPMRVIVTPSEYSQAIYTEN